MTKADWNEFQRTAAGLRWIGACEEAGDLGEAALELAGQVEDWLEGIEPEPEAP